MQRSEKGPHECIFYRGGPQGKKLSECRLLFTGGIRRECWWFPTLEVASLVLVVMVRRDGTEECSSSEYILGSKNRRVRGSLHLDCERESAENNSSPTKTR